VPLKVLRQAAGDGLVALVRLSYEHNNHSIEDDLLTELANLSIEEYYRNLSVHTLPAFWYCGRRNKVPAAKNPELSKVFFSPLHSAYLFSEHLFRVSLR